MGCYVTFVNSYSQQYLCQSFYLFELLQLCAINKQNKQKQIKTLKATNLNLIVSAAAGVGILPKGDDETPKSTLFLIGSCKL